MAKTRGRLFFYAILFIILFLGWIQIFIQSYGSFLRLELLGFAFLMFLTLIGFIGYRTWGENVFFFVFMFYLVNLLVLWYFRGSLQVTLIVLAAIGFMSSFPRKCCGCVPSKEKDLELSEPVVEVVEEEPEEEVSEEKEVMEEEEPETVEEEPVVEKTEKKEAKKTTHSPGKYVASANSNIYHQPKCEWAKKIKEERRVWFADKDEALEKGYRGHHCVK